ncbi:hypothetical protein [Acidisphaera sp. S103]|uniref:hypothetical protein n=1 Tax=Acidisphaera sp. S103 TaxID=1747223 RepID=UPI00131D2D86|nr:hypothetical protein [Acidisphaera sp. S103]
MERRVWSLACFGLLSLADIPADFEFHPDLQAQSVEAIFLGGTMIVDPTGMVVATARDGKEEPLFAELSLAAVRKAQQNFDPAGHYARQTSSTSTSNGAGWRRSRDGGHVLPKLPERRTRADRRHVEERGW